MSEQQEIIEIKLSDFFNFENNWVTALIVSIVVLLIIGFLYSSAFVYVKPGEYGLKQVNIGLFSKKGIQKEKYGPGLHFVMPFGFERMHKFPRTLQVLEMSSAEDNSRRSFLPAAKIQTSDGFFVDVDVSIIYRIYDSYKINNFFGLGSSYLSNGIEPKAEPILKASLGKLTVEDFYNSIKRVEMLKEAQRNLNAELYPKGIEIYKVLIRYFRYSEQIQKNIEEKKLKDQLVYKNKAEAAAAKAKANFEKVQEEGRANVKVQLARGKTYVTKKTADIDLYKRKKVAEADLLIELAKAKALELKNNALRGTGSDILVGLEMADVFKGINTIILPSSGKYGLNPLNLNNLLNLSDVKKSNRGE